MAVRQMLEQRPRVGERAQRHDGGDGQNARQLPRPIEALTHNYFLDLDIFCWQAATQLLIHWAV